MEDEVEVGGVPTRYLRAGEGPPLVLLHGAGASALEWSWVLSAIAESATVYAPDLPGARGVADISADYSSAGLASFLAGFLDAVGIRRAAVVGHSLGGLPALRLALSDASRVAALSLVASAGLGREASGALRAAILPGYGEAAVTWSRTPVGAYQRAWGRAALLFARPGRVPPAWISQQCRLAQRRGFLEANLVALRAQLDREGQREILLEELPRLRVPTLIVWGERDAVVPCDQARSAAGRLDDGRLEILPSCGHLPHVERPEEFASIVTSFVRKRRGDEIKAGP